MSVSSSSIIEQLTPRERQILTLIGEGFSLPEIAQQLHRSIKTVETHRLTLGRKLEATNRVELAKIAIQTGLVQLNGDSSTDASHATQSSAVDDDASTLRMLQDLDSEIGIAVEATYLRKLTCAITGVLEFDYAGVCDLLEIDGALHARSLFTSRNGAVTDTFTYLLEGSPCKETVDSGKNICLSGVAEKYPLDKNLADIGAESYFGYRLDTAEGRPLGVIWMVSCNPMNRADAHLNLLRLIACRTATELTQNISVLQHLEEDEARERLAEELNLPTLLVSRSNARLDVLLNIYHLFTKVMPTGVVAFDRDLKIHFANPAAAQIFHREVDNLIGKKVTSLFTEESLAKFYEENTHVCAMGKVLDIQIDGKRDDGSTIPLRMARSGLFDSDGKVNGTIALLAEAKPEASPI